MTTLDKAKFIHKAYYDCKNFDKEMLQKPQKEKVINVPEQVVILMSHLFTISPAKMARLEQEANDQKLNIKEKLKRIQNLYIKKKHSMNPLIKLVKKKISLSIYLSI